MNIRLARPNDLHRGLIPTIEGIKPVHRSPKELEPNYERLMGPCPRESIVGWEEDQGGQNVIAHTSITFAPNIFDELIKDEEGQEKLYDEFAYLESVVVREGFRSKGRGHRMVNRAVQAAFGRPIYAIKLICQNQEVEPALVPFYEKHGFVVTKQVVMRLDRKRWRTLPQPLF